MAPTLLDGLGFAFGSVDGEAGAKEMMDVVEVRDDEVGVEDMIGDDEVAEDVGDADVADGFAPAEEFTICSR